jgi:enoyl-CoA hydratase
MSVVTEASGHLIVTDDASVRTITFDRPQARNALNKLMREELCALLAAAERDDSVRAVILTGTDPAFTAGVDFKDTDGGFGPYDAQFAINPGRALRAMQTPVVCAVNGACISGGLEIALSSAFVVASQRALFADTHARLNAVPTWGLTALLPRAVGVRKAREMSLTGALVDAQTALRIGLVNHVVPHEELLPFTQNLAASFAATPAAGEILALYARGMDLDESAAHALETAHTARRTMDTKAFTDAGLTVAASNRQPKPSL